MEKMDLEYIKRLAIQYKNAYDLKDIDLLSKSFLSELNEWIGELKKQGEDYTFFLDSLNINYKKLSVAEVGKGEYDSVVKPYNTSIITKMPITADNNLINANFLVLDDGAKLLLDSHSFKFIVSSNFSTYMTQNPYELDDLENWEDLSLLHGCNIIIGMYGNIADKDRKQKLEELYKIREKMGFIGKIDTETKDGNYFSVLTNKKKIKFKSIFR